MKSVKLLRPYQEDVVLWALRQFNAPELFNLLIVLSTGSGKTLLLQVLMRYILEARDNKIKKIVILAPQHTVVDGFTRDHKSGCAYKSDRIGFLNMPLRPLRILYETVDLSVLLRSATPGAYIACYQSLTNTKSSSYNVFDGIDDCSDMLIVVDEAHHLGTDNLLTASVSSAMQKGARVIASTATPFRPSGELNFIRQHNFVKHAVPLSDLIAQGYAPRLRSRIVSVDVGRDGIFTPDIMAKCFVNEYNNAERPKSLVLIPATKSIKDLGKTKEHAQKFIDACHRLDPSIRFFNALDCDRDALDAECTGRTYHDVTITCPIGKYREGTDDPKLAAAFYFVRIKSPIVSSQLPGRLTRMKQEGYLPEQYQHESLQVFFVPEHTDDEEMASTVLKFIVRSEDPLGAAVLPPVHAILATLQQKVQQHLETGDDSEAEALAAFSDQIQRGTALLLAKAVEDVDPVLALETAACNGQTLSELVTEFGGDSDVVRLALVQKLAEHPEATEVEDLQRHYRRGKEELRPFHLLEHQFALLTQRYADEKIQRSETLIDADVLRDWHARWKHIRQRSDYDKAVDFLSTWTTSKSITRNDSTAYATYVEFKSRNLLAQVLPVKGVAQDVVNALEHAGAYEYVFSDNWSSDLVVRNRFLYTLQLFIPLALWVNKHRRLPQRSLDRVERVMSNYMRDYTEKMKGPDGTPNKSISSCVARIMQALSLEEIFDASR